jgi:mycothiol system anti-sigma-R factor
MRCDDVLTRLWEYLDEELAPEEARAVRAHLSDCRHCHPAYCCDRALLELLARQRDRYVAPKTLGVNLQLLLSISGN